jgi:CRISPR-associated protein Csd2
MFDLDRSAARCGMAPRGLFVFEHASALGEFPAHLLFDRIKIAKREEVEIPRSFGDYVIDVDAKDLPHGVQFLQPFGVAAAV